MLDRIPADTVVFDRARLLSVARRRTARRSSRTCTAATGSTSARPRSTGRRTATSWTAGSRRRRFCGRPGGAVVSPRRAIDDGRDDRGPVLHRRRRGRQARRPHRPVHRHRRALPHRRGRRHRRRDLWPNTLGRRATRTSGATSRAAALPLRPHTSTSATGRDVRRQSRSVTDYLDELMVHRNIEPLMPFLPVDFQGLRRPRLYPVRDQRSRRARHRPRVRRVPGRRTHRRVARHAPVVAVARGRVHRRRAGAGRRRRRLRHVRDRHALLRRRARRARRRRADHRVAQPGRVQRHQDGPARGVSAVGRRGHRRDSRHGDRRARFRPPRGPQGTLEHALAARRLRRRGSWASSTRPSIKPFNVVLDAGSGMAGLVAPRLFDRLPCRTTRLCFEIDGTVPESRGQSAHRGEPASTSPSASSPRRRTSASRGTATPTAASSSTARGEFISGDFITALLAEAALHQVAGRDDHLRRARELRRQGHRRAATAARRS